MKKGIPFTMQLTADIEQFDWRNFQQEYRDYIDLANTLNPPSDLCFIVKIGLSEPAFKVFFFALNHVFLNR